MKKTKKHILLAVVLAIVLVFVACNGYNGDNGDNGYNGNGVTVAAPGEFSLTAPAGNANVDTLTPTFTWGASDNAVSYTLAIATANTFTDASIIIVRAGITGMTYTLTEDVALNYLTDYFWRVTAINESYSTVALGSGRRFTTPQEPRPGAFNLTAPVAQAMLRTHTPTFTWTESIYATSYTLQISTNNTFSDIVISRPGLTVTTYTLAADAALASESNFFWRVIAARGTHTLNGTGSGRMFITPAEPIEGNFNVTDWINRFEYANNAAMQAAWTATSQHNPEDPYGPPMGFGVALNATYALSGTHSGNLWTYTNVFAHVFFDYQLSSAPSAEANALVFWLRGSNAGQFPNGQNYDEIALIDNAGNIFLASVSATPGGGIVVIPFSGLRRPGGAAPATFAPQNVVTFRYMLQNWSFGQTGRSQVYIDDIAFAII